jgi:hypothetical protein
VEREQAIGLLNDGQKAHLVADVFNCNVCKNQLLRRRYNASDGTVDSPRSGRQRVTTQRQDRHILRHHLQDRFATAA